MKNNGSIINIGSKTRRILRSLNESGATAVEFALVLPLFLLVIFGIFEYGWLMTQQILLNHAVSEGARAAVRMTDGASDQDLRDEATAVAKKAFRVMGTLTDDDIVVDILAENAPPYLPGYKVPRRVSVAVNAFSYKPLVGFLPDAAVPDTLAADVVFIIP